MAAKRNKNRKPKIVIAGATGLIGRRLTSFLEQNNYQVVPVTRKDIALGVTHLAHIINGANTVINLVGATVLRYWSESYKQEILNSRVQTTKMLVDACCLTRTKPQLFISTSSIAIYNEKDIHDEFSTLYGDSFISKVCQAWEDSTQPLFNCQETRLVIFRLSTVLDRRKGAFPKFALPFRLFMGGKIGDGQQWFPFIHIDDLLSAYWFAIKNQQAEGIYNLVIPNNITNAKFSKILAHLLHRPSFFKVPLWVFKLRYGEGAKIIIRGQYVKPHRLVNDGFHFQYPTAEKAIKKLLE
jgi:uncharacterized protein (TIGR01777 family)